MKCPLQKQPAVCHTVQEPTTWGWYVENRVQKKGYDCAPTWLLDQALETTVTGKTIRKTCFVWNWKGNVRVANQWAVQATVFCLNREDLNELPWHYLPIFRVIHRNEFSVRYLGWRVHLVSNRTMPIFSVPLISGTEIAGVFDLLKKVYGIFGFWVPRWSYPPGQKNMLVTWIPGTLPKEIGANLKRFLGWRQMELNPGDGAFWSKIDGMISDALKD